jgi:hypothetical protein
MFSLRWRKLNFLKISRKCSLEEVASLLLVRNDGFRFRKIVKGHFHFKPCFEGSVETLKCCHIILSTIVIENEEKSDLTLSPVMGQTPPLARVPATTAMLSAIK